MMHTLLVILHFAFKKFFNTLLVLTTLLLMQNKYEGDFQLFKSYYADLLILELDRAAPQTPIQLAPSTFHMGNLKNATALGWGFIDAKDTFPKVLQYATLPAIKREKCKAYAVVILPPPPRDHECFGMGKNPSSNTCKGDSGGPYIINTATGPMQVALTSRGMQWASAIDHGRFLVSSLLRQVAHNT